MSIPHSKVASIMKSNVKPGIVAALVAQLGDAVLVDDDTPTRNERDWSTLQPVRPLAMVLRICIRTWRSMNLTPT